MNNNPEPASRKILITGITGMVGRVLAKVLQQRGFEVMGLTRNPEKHPEFATTGVELIYWNGSCGDSWFRKGEGIKAVINLAGENIASGKWTHQRKTTIKKSRLHAVHAIQDAFTLMDAPPPLLLQTSATGYYGIATPSKVDETSPPGDGFLSEVCQTVEKQAVQTEKTKVIILRFGTVLDRKEGALGKMTVPMKVGLCGYPFPGNNMVSWIHIEDLCAAIVHILELKEHQPVYNLTSPEPVSLKKLIKQAAKEKHIPICLPIPSLLMKAALGSQMVSETLLADQKVDPRILLESGFKFRYPEIGDAMRALFT